MANEFSKDGKRATTAVATAQGEGSMNGGTWNTHRTICHKTSSAAKTASGIGHRDQPLLHCSERLPQARAIRAATSASNSGELRSAAVRGDGKSTGRLA